MPLPLVELHLHLEGTLEPDFILERAAANDIELPWTTLEDLLPRYEFTDLQSFLDLLYTNVEVLRSREDFAEMTRRYLRRAAKAGVKHAEVSFDIQAHIRRGVPMDVVVRGIRDALDASVEEFDITTKLIASFWRDRPVEEAIELLTAMLDAGYAIDAVGLDSAEVGYPPSLFVELYEFARSKGLRAVAHAGEEGPANYVRDALDLLHAERIDHGIRSLEDDDLVQRLVRDQVPLTVCPLSNVRLRTVPALSDHPLPRMLALGINVSVHSDDPSYFGGYIDDNFDAVASTFNLSEEDVGRLTLNAVDSSFLDPEAKARLRSQVRLGNTQGSLVED
ncbi:adenosine deaminase [Microbacterium sp. SS28]|uniref:adenosine deaminase n=1 Tax=Microbacterium sp. SS28 TaxID=2919948 RepID=UPI001FAA763A|nr:adenosine deaminase [Microbacterium sp. SS28]